jgi:hypothetical protein
VTRGEEKGEAIKRTDAGEYEDMWIGVQMDIFRTRGTRSRLVLHSSIQLDGLWQAGVGRW